MRIVSILSFFVMSVCGVYADLPSGMFAGSMDRTFYSSKGAVFHIKYTSLKVAKYTKIMNVSVPSQIELHNLSVVANAVNITDSELNLAKAKVPFSISATPFLFSLNGKSKTVKFMSDTALLTPINTILLKGAVRVVVGQKSLNIGEEASLELKGRILYLSFSGKKTAFKF